jgi:radical SAM protein with 4Fe4S-binding SPASM domain
VRLTIFDEWVRQDVGVVSVGMFDQALEKWAGVEGLMCVFSETCGAAMAMEDNGDLYSCDHSVYPDFKRGNILGRPLLELANSPAQRQFGENKRDYLPAFCRSCEVRFACNGGGRSVFEFSPLLLLDQSETYDVTILAAGLGLISADGATTTFTHPRAAVSPDDVTGCCNPRRLVSWPGYGRSTRWRNGRILGQGSRFDLRRHRDRQSGDVPALPACRCITELAGVCRS